MSRFGLPRRALGLAGLGLLAPGALGAQEASGLLGEVLRLRRLRAGVMLNNPPWSHLNRAGEMDGYEVVLVRRLAQALGVRLDLLGLVAGQRLSALESGTVDVLAASLPLDPLTITRVALSRPHGRLLSVMAMRAGEEVRGLAGLRERRVAVAVGTFMAEAVAEGLPPRTEVIFLADFAACLQALADRDADGAAVPYWMLRSHLFEYPDSALRAAFMIREWQLALAVGLGQRDLLHYVNGFLRLEHLSGALASLQRQYFEGATFDLRPNP